jgi:hypothetical protein
MSDERPSDDSYKSDPLAGADVGETREITVTNFHSLWDTVWGSPMHGPDREHSDVEIVDARIEGDHGDEEIILEIRAETMKTLPRRWKRTLGPQRETTRQTSRRKKSSATLISWMTNVSVVFAVGYLATRIHNAASDISINGQTLVQFDPLAIATTLALIWAIVWLIFWGISGGFPRPVIQR